ncbi:MAG TPA: hypothetical protein VNS58_00660 [Puia sp.]|nr:hypothetical protein [Puia sp.]
MVNRDRRYELISVLFKEGKIQTFNDIFVFVPKTIVATNMGKKVDRFTLLMNRVEKFTLENIFQIGKLCDLGESQMLELVMKEYSIQKKKNKK